MSASDPKQTLPGAAPLLSEIFKTIEVSTPASNLAVADKRHLDLLACGTCASD